MKKATAMPMELVVAAVVLLIVGGVLGYIFIVKGTTPFSRGLAECKEKGGACVAACEEGSSVKSFKGCYDTNNTYQKESVCCIPIT